MILGFSGVNYTGWLYIAWLPGYLQAQQGLSLARTGWVAAIPFLAAAVGMWVNGLVVDALARRGYDLAKTRKTAIVIGLVLSALGTLLVVQSSTPTQAVAFISMALFCVHFAGTSAWGLVQVWWRSIKWLRWRRSRTLAALCLPPSRRSSPAGLWIPLTLSIWRW
jgi:MFS family permease